MSATFNEWLDTFLRISQRRVGPPAPTPANLRAAAVVEARRAVWSGITFLSEYTRQQARREMRGEDKRAAAQLRRASLEAQAARTRARQEERKPEIAARVKAKIAARAAANTARQRRAAARAERVRAAT